MPLCCVGAVCIVGSHECKRFIEKYKKIIAIYGGEKNMIILANKICKENEIFRTSTTEVNNIISPQFITPNISLFDIISVMNPKIQNIVSNSKKTKTQYISDIWDQYQKNGGNYHVIVYGLIEYLCTIYDPTCITIENYIDPFIADTMMKVECLSHKSDAGM
jgi:hypothetical protein